MHKMLVQSQAELQKMIIAKGCTHSKLHIVCNNYKFSIGVYLENQESNQKVMRGWSYIKLEITPSDLHNLPSVGLRRLGEH